MSSTKPTGNYYRHGQGWTMQIRFMGGRNTFRLAVQSDEDAKARTALVADAAFRLPRAPLVLAREDIAKILDAIAGARNPALLKRAVDQANDIASGSVERVSSAAAPTFAHVAQQWTSGELHRLYPDRVKAKDNIRDGGILGKHINPTIGAKRITDITLEDLDAVMSKLPATLASATRRHVAQVMRKVMQLAVYPLKHISANPAPRGFLPTKGAAKARECLYPSEDAQLLACAAIPLVRRMAYGLLAREGTRGPSELAEFRWSDIDLVRGRVRLDVNKTDMPRSWALSRNSANDAKLSKRGTVDALKLWKEHFSESAEDNDRVLLDGGRPLILSAAQFRKDLKTAGITRPELFKRTASRIPIRVHDLRAVFVTASLANGWTETEVTDRTGHTTSGQLRNYYRGARAWNEMGLGDLAPLDQAIPELAVASQWPAVGFGRMDSNHDKENQNLLSCH